MTDGRGRPRKYHNQIHAITVEQGWVPICEQKSRGAAPGFAARYPGFAFRSVPSGGYPIEDKGKPYILEARRLS